jgi:hypothetical protein
VLDFLDLFLKTRKIHSDYRKVSSILKQDFHKEFASERQNKKSTSLKLIIIFI